MLNKQLKGKLEIYNYYIKLGNFSYLLVLPILRFFIRHTRRAYIMLYYGGEILVIKNWLGSGLWSLPGGGINHNEDPRDAALRELNEELGLKVDKTRLELVSKGRWRTDHLGHFYYIYSVNCYFKNIKTRRIEITEAKWMPVEKFRLENTPGEVLRVINNINFEHGRGERT